MTIRHFLLAGAALGALGHTATARAAGSTPSATFQVSANVVASCQVSANPLPFGTITSNLLQSQGVAATTTITINCGAGLPVKVELQSLNSIDHKDGTGQLGTATLDRITYGLFQDSGHSTPWGTEENALTVTATGSAQNLIVYGRIQPQPATSGLTMTSHEDTVNVFVNF